MSVSRAFSALRLAEDWSPGATFCRGLVPKGKVYLKVGCAPVWMLFMAQPQRDHHDVDSSLQRMTRAHVWRIKRTGVDDVRSKPTEHKDQCKRPKT